jgi:hypothetical protein
LLSTIVQNIDDLIGPLLSLPLGFAAAVTVQPATALSENKKLNKTNKKKKNQKKKTNNNNNNDTKDKKNKKPTDSAAW